MDAMTLLSLILGIISVMLSCFSIGFSIGWCLHSLKK